MKKINGRIEFINGKKIDFELYPEIAPISVENFCSLAKSGFYDGLCFHRVISSFMIQGGGFKAENGLINKPAPRTIKGEFACNGINNPLSHTTGVMSMARTSVPDSASSQFFICVADVPFLDNNYAAFGKVTSEEGIKNSTTISNVKTTSWNGYDDVPVKPIVMKTITIFD